MVNILKIESTKSLQFSYTIFDTGVHKKKLLVEKIRCKIETDKTKPKLKLLLEHFLVCV